MIGVESKRHEPFRDVKSMHFAEAYDRDVWGTGMAPFERLRDRLRAVPEEFRHLDATQLVKHALGLATEARRLGKSPVLLYLYAEPARYDRAEIELHRNEVQAFAEAVRGAEVRFAACRWRDWLDKFTGGSASHADRIIDAFAP